MRASFTENTVVKTPFVFTRNDTFKEINIRLPQVFQFLHSFEGKRKRYTDIMKQFPSKHAVSHKTDASSHNRDSRMILNIHKRIFFPYFFFLYQNAAEAYRVSPNYSEYIAGEDSRSAYFYRYNPKQGPLMRKTCFGVGFYYQIHSCR